MTSEFELLPYRGASPIHFNMCVADVEATLGPPDNVSENSLGERDEARGSIGIRYSSDDGYVAEIALMSDSSLFFKGKDLLADPPPLAFLLQCDPQPLEFLGFLVFLKLGITTTGFHDNDAAQKALTIFRQGRWNDYADHFVPYK